MARNNTRARKEGAGRVAASGDAQAPSAIIKKTLAEALVAGYENPAQFCRDFLDFSPYPEQEKFLLASRDCVESNLAGGNRVGKSALAGAILLWRAFYRYISTVTRPDLVSPHVTYKAVATSLTADQAKLSWNYAYTYANNSPRFKPFIADVVHSPFPTMRLSVPQVSGGYATSEIWARSLAKNGLYLLGHSLSFVLMDEYAFIKGADVIEDEVVRMRLADQGGNLMRLSSPNGKNHFYAKFQSGIGNAHTYSQAIPTTANPYVSKAYIEEMKRLMLPEYYRQNVLCEWVSLSDFFKTEHIQALYAEQEYELPMPPVTKGEYVLGADLGAMRDPTVVFVLRVDVTPAQLVYVMTVKNGSWASSREAVRAAYQRYGPVSSVIDATGVGAPVAQQLIEEDGFQNTEAFVFSSASKPEVLTALQDAVQRRSLVFPFTTDTRELVNQMGFYRLDDKRIAQDFVIALALVNRARERAKKQNAMETMIPDDLQIVPVWGTNKVPLDLLLPEDEAFSGGIRFRHEADGTFTLAE